MIDLISIAIPFKDSCFDLIHYDRNGIPSGADLNMIDIAAKGVTMASGSVDVSRDCHGDYITDTSGLYHKYESLPSSFGSVAFKIYQGGHNYWPFVEIKASPAKLLQGHNIFGSDNVNLCIDSVLSVFVCEFDKLNDLLDFPNSKLQQIDCTFSAKSKNTTESKQIIQALKNVSNGQIRESNHAFSTSVLWNAGSKMHVLESYLKEFEVVRQLEKLNKIKNPKDFELRQIEQLTKNLEYAKNLVRFEAKIKYRKLARLGVPVLLRDFKKYAQDFNGCLIQYLWKECFKKIFETFEGEQVNIYNDADVYEKLSKHYKADKAKRLFRFFRDIKNEGIDSVKEYSSTPTFYRNMKDLTFVVPKSYLQNLKSISSNVVPLVRLIDVNFENQLPADFVEPECLSSRLRSIA